MRTDVQASTEFAQVAHDIWVPHVASSDAIRPLIPSGRDLLDEVRRSLNGVELMPRSNTHRRHLALAVDPDRLFKRERFYTRVFVDAECVDNADDVRRACFEAARLLGKHLARRVEQVRDELKPPAGASVDYTSIAGYLDSLRPAPMTVRFNGDVMNWLNRDDRAFACLDAVSDRIAWHFASYFCIAPPGEEWEPDDAH